MKKLYIIYFYNDDKLDFDTFWTTEKKEDEIIRRWKIGVNNKIYSLPFKGGLIHIKEAINKEDIANALDRYITKPLLNKTLITFSHGN